MVYYYEQENIYWENGFGGGFIAYADVYMNRGDCVDSSGGFFVYRRDLKETHLIMCSCAIIFPSSFR